MASTIILSDNGASSGSAGLKSTAGNDGVLILQTTTSGGTATNAIYVDSLQNIGIRATPETWYSPVAAIRIGSAGTVSATTNGTANSQYRCNEYIDASGTTRYIITGAASRYQQYGGSHSLYSAPSGTAGDAITFTAVATVTKDYTFALQGGTSGAGTGISFPATQSASSDANTLDDYEEGTWTPTLTFAGGTTGITYNLQGGGYTKVGNVVTLNCRVGLTNKGSSTGSARITGLPFMPGSFAYQAIQVGQLWWTSYSNASNYMVNVRADNGQAFIELKAYSTSSEVTLDQTFFNNSTTFAFTISYLV